SMAAVQAVQSTLLQSATATYTSRLGTAQSTLYRLKVSNLSGMELASAALKARELRKYLREKQNFEPSLAVMPVDYGENRSFAFNNVEDILRRFQKKPVIQFDALEILETESEIEDFFRKAEDELNKLRDE
ncbi:MAG: hypothetical protein IKO93_07315, partial [Lentisphaeria bacterium]|nr:hypothetical protein [Lentisphaeria bacterium]